MDSIIPPEIVTKILSNLGKSDLLNCRLVCKSWNKECLKHLRKSKFTQPLCGSSIKSYMELVKCNQHPQFVLPFCIRVGIDFSYGTVIDKMNEFIKHLRLLANMFGPDCVIGLGLVFKNMGWGLSTKDIFIDFLLQVFNITSFGLEMLDFSRVYFGWQRRFFLISLDTNLKSPYFQNLKKLKFDHDRYGQLFEFILDNSPNLQNLKISYGYISTISSIPMRFEKLETLKLGNINNPSDFLRIIQNFHSFPVLQKLKLGLSVSSEIEKEIFYDILNSFSKTIKSLTITYEEYIPGFIIPFPTFPQLRYLKLIIKTSNKSLIHLDCQPLNFKPQTFPMLKSIVVSVGYVFLSHGLLNSLSLDVSTSSSTLYSIFSNIQHLTLNVHDCWNLKISRNPLANPKLVDKMFHKNVEGLQSIFPNVTDIVIVDKPKQTKHYIQELIKKLIQSNRASIIQNFTLWNCEQDYLGKVLNPLSYQPHIFLENLKLSTEIEQTIKDGFQNITDSSDDTSIRRNVLNGTNPEKNISIVEENTSPVNHYMKNVNTIKFEYSRVDEDGKIRSMRNGNMTMTVNMLDLTLIVNEFPNLCQIGISSLLFDPDQQKRSKQIHDIRTQFHNITINII